MVRDLDDDFARFNVSYFPQNCFVIGATIQQQFSEAVLKWILGQILFVLGKAPASRCCFYIYVITVINLLFSLRLCKALITSSKSHFALLHVFMAKWIITCAFI